MMQTMFIQWWLLLLAITSINGSGIPWGRDDRLGHERIMETILTTCYENDSSSSPTIIIGDCNIHFDKSSIIRLDNSMKSVKYSINEVFRIAPASRVIIVAELPEQIWRSITQLSTTIWWDISAHYFIAVKENESCANSMNVLAMTVFKRIPNVIFICAQSTYNTTLLITMNTIGNYAPHPWRKIGSKRGNYHLFYRIFNPQSLCTNLHYDRTTILNGFKINMIAPWRKNQYGIKPGRKMKVKLTVDNRLNAAQKIMNTIVMKLNATPFLEFVKNDAAVEKRLMDPDADIDTSLALAYWHFGISYLFPFFHDETVAIVKLNREVSTLEKIFNLWSPPVLILAAIALLILYLVLTIINHDFSLALLDFTRLLIYSSIFRISGRHSFRIYLTTMLIFMVISNGVFQGKIAAFLTTRERKPAIKTIDEFVKLDYKIYTYPGFSAATSRKCPTCKPKEVPIDHCIKYVLNSTRHSCVMPNYDYERYHYQKDLDRVKEPFYIARGFTFCHRKGWLLANSANRIVIRLIESGLTHFWNNQHTYEARQKRKEREAEWSSTEYRPVKLHKLTFAFYGLALGLFISTMVFLLELLVANWKVWKRKCCPLTCLKKCWK